jgi:hypothetical protein
LSKVPPHFFDILGILLRNTQVLPDPNRKKFA